MQRGVRRAVSGLTWGGEDGDRLAISYSSPHFLGSTDFSSCDAFLFSVRDPTTFSGRLWSESCVTRVQFQPQWSSSHSDTVLGLDHLQDLHRDSTSLNSLALGYTFTTSRERDKERKGFRSNSKRETSQTQNCRRIKDSQKQDEHSGTGNS